MKISVVGARLSTGFRLEYQGSWELILVEGSEGSGPQG